MAAILPAITAISQIIDHFIPNASQSEKDRMALLLQKDSHLFDMMKAQMAVNQVEAANPSVFVSGARPFIMWVCGIAFAWQFIALPMLNYLVALSGHAPLVLPVFDYTSLNEVLFGLLGLGALRTVEKLKGVNGSHV